MCKLNSSILLVAGLLGVSTSVLAGAGSLTTTVERLQDKVTYSVGGVNPLVTFVGYKVTIKNEGGNTINNIRFTGTTTVTDLSETVQFSAPAEGATCTTVSNPAGAPINAQTISCGIGQLSADQAYPTFAVFFRAPVKGTSDTVPDIINFYGVTYYAEGTGGAKSTPLNSTGVWPELPQTAADIAVVLGTNNPTLVRSSVPKAGGTFFTGDGAASKGSDRFTTWVNVPPADKFSTADIEETFTTNCNNFVVCWGSNITIDGNNTSTYLPYLTIVLRQDALNIVKGTQIESVTIEYEYLDSDNQTQRYPVGPCADKITPLDNGLPCIAERTFYKNSRVGGWTLELDGDFEWKLISLKNGRFNLN